MGIEDCYDGVLAVDQQGAIDPGSPWP